MTELQILTALKNNNGSIEYVALMNMGKTDLNWDPLGDKDLIENLLETHILSGKTRSQSVISFGKLGRLRLRDLQQQEQLNQERNKESTKEKAEKKKQQRFENKLAVLNTIIPIITFVLGLILGHLDLVADICADIGNLFRSFS